MQGVKMGLCVLVILLTTLQAVSAEFTTVITPWGTLQGMKVLGDGGRPMTAFLGIPYALAPVGELRYERPRSHPGPGNSPFLANTTMLPCPQRPWLIGSSRKTSEDCLKLDVYVPVHAQPTDSQAFAVMVFIHGGGFYSGEGSIYKPSRLVADGKVIVVVIQYRLGVLGFLTSGDNVLPGNLGLWDQNLALRWVHKNIRSFGGDPDRITIFGESAGSWSVGYHLIMPLSRGLFHRAIMQSGAPQILDRYVDFFGRKNIFSGLTDLLGCQGNSQKRLMCLKQQPVDHLIKVSTEYDMKSPMFTYYFPVADGLLIPRRPKDLLEDTSFLEHNARHVDLITGFNSREGSIVLLSQIFAKLPSQVLYTAQFFRGTLHTCFIFDGLANSSVALRKVTEFYYRGADYSSEMSPTIDPVVSMLGDCLINAPTVQWATRMAAAPHYGSRYMYILDQQFHFNSKGPVPGTHHIDDVLLLFDLVHKNFPEDSLGALLNKTYMTPQEWALSDRVVHLWTSFAKTGDPNGALDMQWPQFSEEHEHHLSLSVNPRVVSGMAPYRNNMALWLTLLPELDRLTSQAQNTGHSHPAH